MADVSKLSIFEGLNPWWTTGEVPSDLCGMERKEYSSQITKYAEKEEVEIVSGIRRCGKTTLLYQAIRYLLKEKKIPQRNILLANCDEAEVKQNFSSIPEIVSTFDSSAEGRKFVFLDEVQYFEDWEQQLKNVFDRHRKNVKLIVSGSSSVLLKSKDIYFLTGRFIPVSVHPFSFKEFLGVKGIVLPQGKPEELHEKLAPLDLDRHLQQYLAYGGFPRVVLEELPDEKIKIAKLYFETILFKDVLKMWEVKDVVALEKIARFALQNIGQRFSYRKISDALQTNLKTTQNYIEYLQTSLMLRFIEYYASSTAQQIKKEKKIFCADNVLHTAYYGYANIGFLAENLVFQQILRRGQKACYWKNSREVDFVVEENGVPLPIEVKYQEKTSAEDFKGLAEFLKRHPQAREGVLVTKNEFGEKKTKEGKIIKLIPLWLYLLA